MVFSVGTLGCGREPTIVPVNPVADDQAEIRITLSAEAKNEL